MPAGRPSKPTALKELQGTARKDRQLEGEMLPELMATIPVADGLLDEVGEQTWYNSCKTLLELGMLHSVDLRALFAYCIEVQTYYEASEIIKAEGLTITEIRGPGMEVTKLNPAVNVRNAAYKNMMAAANQFGFTPAARTRIKGEKKEDGDEFGKTFGI